MKLELGGGKNPKEGYKNLDIRNLEEVDYIVDLEKGDLSPIKTESVEKIYSHHTFEHIENIIPLMNEVWRILKWGGELEVIVPHIKSTLAWQDPTHKRYWTEESMKFFCGRYLKKYSLDYEIKTCFKQLENKVFVPKGYDNSKKNTEMIYNLQIRFLLKKDRDWVEKVDYNLLNKRIFGRKRKPGVSGGGINIYE